MYENILDTLDNLATAVDEMQMAGAGDNEMLMDDAERIFKHAMALFSMTLRYTDNGGRGEDFVWDKIPKPPWMT